MSGPTHLAIRPPSGSDRPVGDAIYVHPTEEPARKLLYLDYWWYLDGNPANIASGATCGGGLAIPGKTCFDHPSDWEGLVVVLDVSGKEARPLAVHFAQHKHVVRYSWSEAQARWATLRAKPPAGLSHGQRKHLNAIRENLAAIPDVAGRPLAFVGQGTHSTYAWPCTGSCHQVVDSITENDYDGERSWSGNVTEACVTITSTCVRLFPTSQHGKRAALWNAFTGVWGHRECILKGTYCTAELSPGAPSTQDRYKKPARITAWVDGDQRPHRCGGDDGPCPALPAAGKGP